MTRKTFVLFLHHFNYTEYIFQCEFLQEKQNEQINLFDSDGKNIVEIASQLMYFLRDMLVDYYISGTLCPYELNDVETLTSLLCEKMFDIKKGNHPRISFELSVEPPLIHITSILSIV